MRVSIILGHPDPDSFNHAIARTARDELLAVGCDVIFHDLSAEGFEPVLPAGEIPKEAELPDDIARHTEELTEAEGLVIVHPNWWGMPPAIMKGWVDRVFRCGLAYEFEEGDGGEGVPIQLLQKLKAAVIFNTGNTPIEREISVFGDPLVRLWKDCILGLCSKAEFHRRYFTVVCESTLEERRAWLEEVRHLVRSVFS